MISRYRRVCAYERIAVRPLFAAAPCTTSAISREPTLAVLKDSNATADPTHCGDGCPKRDPSDDYTAADYVEVASDVFDTCRPDDAGSAKQVYSSLGVV